MNYAAGIKYWRTHQSFSEQIWRPHVQQPPTVYCPSQQTDCLPDFPRSATMKGVVIPQWCRSYGIHLALPVLWGISSHPSSVCREVSDCPLLQGATWLCKFVKGYQRTDRLCHPDMPTEQQEHRVPGIEILILSAESQHCWLTLATDAVPHLAHLTLDV